LRSGDNDGSQSRSTHDESFGDELLDGAGGGLVADAILGAEFDGPRQLVPSRILIGGLVLSGEDRRAECICDLTVGSLPREGQEAASRDVEPSV
jgi:hypothetical protein